MTSPGHDLQIDRRHAGNTRFGGEAIQCGAEPQMLPDLENLSNDEERGYRVYRLVGSTE
jgi:hypothetical protein